MPQSIKQNTTIGGVGRFDPLLGWRGCRKSLGIGGLSSNISPTCPHNTVNFGPLAAEILSLVWGTPGNFNGFRVLAVLLHGNLVVGVSQTAALNRERHLSSAGRPSRWAFAHISSSSFFFVLLLSSFFSSPNLSGRRLDVYHTLAHGVALVRI